jgi:hypothetical protein
VDLLDESRIAQVQLVEAAIEKDPLLIEHGPHRSIADEDPLVDKLVKRESFHTLASQPVDVHHDCEVRQHSGKAVSMQAILLTCAQDRGPDKIVTAAALLSIRTPFVGVIPHIYTT